MRSFVKRLEEKRTIILDGATGSELNRRGVDTNLPLWSAKALLVAPEVVEAIHLDYLRAGAEVITTNTFRTHFRTLDRAGFGSRTAELTQLAVHLTQQAVHSHISQGGQPAWIAGSVSPLEDCYSPELVPSQEECLREHASMIRTLAESGVDLILIETMNTIREALAAATAAMHTQLPYIISFVLRSDGQLFSGESLEDAVATLENLPPTMFGINCTPSATITPELKKLRQLTQLPICGYANIGETNQISGWSSTQNVSPDAYADMAIQWARCQVNMIGGCCGTTPAHIQALTVKLNAFSSSDLFSSIGG